MTRRLIIALCLCSGLAASEPLVLHDANPAVRAALLASKINGTACLTSGTPSMEPLIVGKVWIVTAKRPIAERDVLVYMGRPDANKKDRVLMCHRAVLQDQGGWLMSGDNNRWSESWDRVTPQTYVATVIYIITHP